MYMDTKREQLRDPVSALRDPEIRCDVFSGMPETGGAGAAATMIARLPDGRRLSWMVEVWIDTWEPGGEWSAVVKGDIDRDDPTDLSANDECLFLEQRRFHDVQ